MKSGSRGTRADVLYSSSPNRDPDDRQSMSERVACAIYRRENIEEHDEALQKNNNIVEQ